MYIMSLKWHFIPSKRGRKIKDSILNSNSWFDIWIYMRQTCLIIKQDYKSRYVQWCLLKKNGTLPNATHKWAKRPSEYTELDSCMWMENSLNQKLIHADSFVLIGKNKTLEIQMRGDRSSNDEKTSLFFWPMIQTILKKMVE